MNQRLVVAISRTIELLSLALWGGGAVFLSFVVAPKIFAVLRDRLPVATSPGVQGFTPEVGQRIAGDIVGSILPLYFATQIVAGSLAVVAGIVLFWGGDHSAKVRTGIAALALLVVTIHAVTVYPRSAGVLEAQHQASDQGDDRKASELHRQFGMWHGISQTLNLLVILLVVTTLVLLGRSQVWVPSSSSNEVKE